MTIDKIELDNLIENNQAEIKKLQEDLEIFLLLKYQLSINNASEESGIQFPNHLSDDALKRAIPKITDSKIEKILDLPLLSQKLVIF